MEKVNNLFETISVQRVNDGYVYEGKITNEQRIELDKKSEGFQIKQNDKEEEETFDINSVEAKIIAALITGLIDE